MTTEPSTPVDGAPEAAENAGYPRSAGALLPACPAEPHWCQNPENPAGYSMHALSHDPYAAQRAKETRMTDEHVHCWHGNESHSDPSCCLCDSSGCRRANDGAQSTEETPMSVTGEKSEGLLPKYRVERNNDPDGKHADCRYFVLDPQHDPLAWRALAYYAALARTEGYEALGADLQGWCDDLYDPDYVYGPAHNPASQASPDEGACSVCGAVDPQSHDGAAHDLDGMIAHDRGRAIRDGARSAMLAKAAGVVNAFRSAVPRLVVMADTEELSHYLSVLDEFGLRAQVAGWEAPPFPIPFLVAADDALAALHYPVTIMAATLASVHAGLTTSA